MKINYYADRVVKLPALRRQTVSRWIQQVIGELGKKVGEITYKFTDDEGLLAANKLFLQHDYYTDILTFEGEGEGDESQEDLIYGDILLSLERIAGNAEKLDLPFEEELHRVMIHGVLHLCGLEDHTSEEAHMMRLAEDRALYLLHKMLDNSSLLR